ncbi:MAG: DUF1573 domain-containing protein [Isosphaeraceae bacterium]
MRRNWALRPYEIWPYIYIFAASCVPSGHDRPVLTSSRVPAGSLPLVARPQPLQLGTLRPGESARATLMLRNRHDHPVEMGRVESSCPCLTIEPRSLRLEPGEEARLESRFDPASEPEFRGRLRIEVRGYSLSDEVVMIATAIVEVSSEVLSEDATTGIQRDGTGRWTDEGHR